MARLNDPPAPATESIDALKRRFIRQNRELARVNSNQSQRIRNLETEISRLLAENIALREKAIHSATEAERWRSSSRLSKDVLALRETLAMKVQEVQILVDELGTLPARVARRPSERRRRSGLVQHTTTNADDEEEKNKQALDGFFNAEREIPEGRLPAILEDKCYPRRTLENGELQSIIDDANRQQQDTESPDLGPPPIAHFEVSEPISFDSGKSPKRVSGGIIPDEEEILALPSNLETRRKRRTSSLLQDLPATLEDTVKDGMGAQDVVLSRPGAKRKLEASQLDAVVDRPLPANDFVFQRKPATTMNSKPSRFTSAPARRNQDTGLQTVVVGPTSPQKVSESTRQALAPKSTNSPTKRQVNSDKDKDKDRDMNFFAKDQRSKLSNQNGTRNKPLRIDLPHEPKIEPQAVILQPKTPGLELADLRSPLSISTQPSTKTTTSEIAITNSVEDVLNGSIGRGSRRARAAVSYAEPNLRDKMRRPDKLVGAVEGIHKRENSSDIDNDRVGRSIKSAQEIEIKSEKPAAETDENWKSLPIAVPNMSPKLEPTSPLRGKEKRIHLVERADRSHKRTFSEAEGTRASETGKNEEHLEKAIQRLSIFDPPASSPTTEDNSERSVSRSSEADSAKTTLQLHNQNNDTNVLTRTRRHSVQIQSLSTNDLKSVHSGLPRQRSAISERDLSSLHREPSSNKLKRASSIQTLANNQSQNTSRTHQRIPSANLGQKSVVEEGNTRTTGTRRRSMMV